MNFSALLFTISDMIGCIAFAVSGAMVGLRFHLDVFGIIVLAITTATGGGLFRDLIIGYIPPMMFRNPVYAIVATSVALLMFLLARYSKNFYRRMEPNIEAWANIFDAIGLGAFTVVGMRSGIAAGYADNGFLLVFLSLLTGVGGGLLRDLFVRQMPGILHKHVYAVAVLAGALFHLTLYRLGVSDVFTSPATICLVFVIRMLATKYRWNLPHAD